MEASGEKQAERDNAIEPRALDRVALWVFFGLLAAYSLLISDHSHVGPWFITTVLLVLAAFYVAVQRGRKLNVTLPFICPALMALYGVAQTLLSDQKIVSAGWEKTVFWFSAAIIGLLGAQFFQWRKFAHQFRIALIVFGSLMALLDLLQQASHTGSYFWLFPSGYSDVFGTFAYHNNFAQFIELTLPITLWEGVRRHEVRLQYVLLAALQFGAVVASGSRAGAGLVVVEFIAVLILVFFRGRESMSIAVAGLALVLTASVTYLAGVDRIAAKLKNHDQLAARRQINEASLAMIKARPLTGWGLGSYVPVYKAFARFDDGTWVNQAHNDYFEWAAEGGIPFACVMVVLILWTVKPSVRSVWAIGLLAMCIHAAVDYPFARLGTCGWYFALAGMLSARAGHEPEYDRRRARRRHHRVSEMEDEPANMPSSL